MMSAITPSIRIRPADRGDLPALHRLATAALTHDTFSADLLDEKLFLNPCPQRYTYHTLIAETATQPVGLMQWVVRPQDGRGWLGLFVVSATARRKGIATALWQRVRDKLRQAGVGAVEVLAIPGNYLTPGLDPRYTEALCFCQRCGFERFGDCVNLSVDLDRRLDTDDDQARLVAAGITVRRATAADSARLDAFFGADFGLDWCTEAGLALHHDPPALHLAIQSGRIIAFSAHSSQNREWGFFGPMGTTPAARGKGIGRVLLRRCLNDLRDLGHRSAVIPWVGPISFYAEHAAGCVARVFWRYRLELT